MSFQAMGLIAPIKKSDLPELEQSGFKTTHKCILLAMANYANENYVLFPSIPTLADDVCCSERTVIRAISDLVKMGFLIKTKRATNTGRESNVYTLNIVSWLKNHGYLLVMNEAGFLKPIKQKTAPEAAENQQCDKNDLQCDKNDLQCDKLSPDPIIDPIIEPKHIVDHEFEELWKAWPNTKNKAGSLKAFRALINKNKDKKPHFIRTSLVQDIQTRLANKQFGFENLTLSTYLNNERWRDGHNEGTATRKDPLLEAMGMA